MDTQRNIWGYRLYAITIFLSAFLLFQIQPLIGRHIIPWFGGATSVWATSLFFFTAMLFFGYAYTYYVSVLKRHVQALVHIWVLGIGVFVVISYPFIFDSVFPPLTWTITSDLDPSFAVLLALTITIGIPYFLLATTGPLVQHWFGIMESKEPYHLYSLSNAASFIALGTYPFIIEPTFTLGFQKNFWTILFVGFAILYGCIAFRFLRSKHSQPTSVEIPREHVTWSVRLTWIGYAALPTALLVATTAQLTQVIAPVPFLWIIPLALYLLTFVIAFRGRGGGGVIATLVLVSAGISFYLLGWDYDAVTRQMAAYLVFFFFTCLYCHAQLYATRPPTPLSSLFYLCIAFGGMIGTIAISIIAPIVFNDIFEFALGVLIVMGLVITIFPAMRYIRDEYDRHVSILRIVGLIILLVFGMQYFKDQNEWYTLVSRNFYGVVKIGETDEDRSLYNGTTFHGKQFLDPEKEFIPSSYYTPSSGVGLAITNQKNKYPDRGISVGTIGLGTGTLAAYCSSKDTFTFYEIDERIERVAREYFTYLEYCDGSDVRIGDGRLLMEKERREKNLGKFDLFVVDAFSDDTIPAHLLTAEAVDLYLSNLRDDTSIVAIHTSNRYLELAPVVTRIARALNAFAITVHYSGEEEGSTSSQWVLISRDKDTLSQPLFTNAASEAVQEIAPIWTDDYMNVFAALSLPALYNWEEDD